MSLRKPMSQQQQQQGQQRLSFGGPASKRQRLGDNQNNETNNLASGSSRQPSGTERHRLHQQQRRDSTGSSFTACPICGKQVPLLCINLHLDAQCPGAPAATEGGSAARSVVSRPMDQFLPAALWGSSGGAGPQQGRGPREESGGGDGAAAAYRASQPARRHQDAGPQQQGEVLQQQQAEGWQGLEAIAPQQLLLRAEGWQGLEATAPQQLLLQAEGWQGQARALQQQQQAEGKEEDQAEEEEGSTELPAAAPRVPAMFLPRGVVRRQRRPEQQGGQQQEQQRDEQEQGRQQRQQQQQQGRRDEAAGALRVTPLPHPRLEGQLIIPDFITPQEEAEVVALCDLTDAPPHPHQHHQHQHPLTTTLCDDQQSPHTIPQQHPHPHRQQSPHQQPPWSPWPGLPYANAVVQRARTKRWGVLPDYHRRGVAPAAHPLPPLLTALAARMRERVGVLRSFFPNEANAIDYRRTRGSWLRPHADDRILSGELIVTLSLLGPAVMTFGRIRNSGSGSSNTRSNIIRSNSP
ncbi:hypothetical protein Agub_g13055, partial [Astrephomene gubernaculifera]